MNFIKDSCMFLEIDNRIANKKNSLRGGFHNVFSIVQKSESMSIGIEIFK